MENKKVIGMRAWLVYFGVFLFAIAIIARLVHIQFVEGDALREKAREMTMRYDPVEEMRGSILSSDGSILATSIPIFDIRMDLGTKAYTESYFSENVDSLAYQLSKLFRDKGKSDYKMLLMHGWNEKDRYLLLKKNATYAQLKKVRRMPIFRLGRFKGGLVAVEKSRRELPFKELALRTIGFERDSLKVGMEGGFSNYLTGTSGKRLVRKLANGAWMPVNSKDDIEPKDGNDIISTLDVNIQDVAEDALLRNLQENEADRGCVILMEVQTGYIKAIANLSRTADGRYVEDMNHAISDAAEPGSTFKTISLMAALNDGLVNLDSTVNITGGRTNFCNQTMKDSHEGGPSLITVREALYESSNVGISKVIVRAYGQHPGNFRSALGKIGVDKPLGLDIRGEGKPYVKDTNDKYWTDCYSVPWMSVGYELQITPIQTLAYYNAIANNGVLVKPLFVKEIRQFGKVVKTFEPEVINKEVCSKEVALQLRSLLEGVVKKGTGKRLDNELYSIAGKTGTAQIHQTNKGFNKSNYKASFVGYFPADKPKYSCIVVVNSPSKGVYYGGAVAAPVFKEIADKIYATQLDIHPKKKPLPASPEIPRVLAGNKYDILTIYKGLGYTPPVKESSAVWIESLGDSTGTRYYDRIEPLQGVPNVIGMSPKDGIYLLEKSGYRVKVVGRGQVASQQPAAGSAATKNSTVILQLGNTL
jgi:cell division protein FtsI (penicillin-binding protein 3)